MGKRRGPKERFPQQQRCGPKGAHRIDLGGEEASSLYISGEAFAQRADAMEALGIRRVVACGCQAHHPNSFHYLEVHVNDSETAAVGRFLPRAADFIAAGLRDGSVLVHCKAGICRSTTMIMAYLLMYRRDIAPSVAAALAVVRGARRCANPRDSFLRALELFDEGVRGREASAPLSRKAAALDAALPEDDSPATASGVVSEAAAADAEGVVASLDARASDEHATNAGYMDGMDLPPSEDDDDDSAERVEEELPDSPCE